MAAKSGQLQIRVTPAEKAAIKRLARRAGLDVSRYVLSRLQPPGRARVADLVRRLGPDADRFGFAALNDALAALAPSEFQEAVAEVDVEGLSPFVQNYVAAMVEQAAGRIGEAPPPWVRGVEPLDRPYFAVPFARLRPYLVRAAPVAFKRRNLFVDATVGDRV